MSGIQLSSAIQQNIINMQQTSADISQSQSRLSTGKKVNSALDNPQNFYAAMGLTDRASDLSGRIDAMGQAISTITAANKGIEGLTKLVEQMSGLVSSARNADATGRAALATQFGTLRGQIDQLITDTGYGGKNLLNGDSLTVSFNEDGSSSLSVTGVTYDSAGLSIAAAANSWAADADIDAAKTAIDAAMKTLRTQAATFGSSLSVVQSRQDFTKGMINTLNEGANKLTEADLNEESAKLLALQTRQQLGMTALSLTNQSQQSILRLF